ncbi:MAG: hypothetical protein L0219_17835 [Phycisphaerales bacterium]|nr:hypothetical protein [Phycisphaerales bacterium]
MTALWRTFYGRYTGAEGALELMVLDVNLIDVPDIRDLDQGIARRIIQAFESMCRREPGSLCEEELLACHTYDRARRLAERPVVLATELQQADRRELDDAVFELLGVRDRPERLQLIDALYRETALHFRAIRVVEIQKMEDRAKGGKSKFKASDLAADAWDAIDFEDVRPLGEWVRLYGTGPCDEIDVPTERPVYLAEGAMAYLAFTNWIWKWDKLQGWLVPFPNLNGTWEGRIHSNWKDAQGKKPGPIPVILTIKQSFNRLSCVMRTVEMESHSYIEGFCIDEENQVRSSSVA